MEFRDRSSICRVQRLEGEGYRAIADLRKSKFPGVNVKLYCKTLRVKGLGVLGGLQKGFFILIERKFLLLQEKVPGSLDLNA